MNLKQIIKSRWPSMGWLYWVYAGVLVAGFALLLPRNDDSFHGEHWSFGVPFPVVHVFIQNGEEASWSFYFGAMLFNLALWSSLFLLPIAPSWWAKGFNPSWPHGRAVAYRLMAIVVMMVFFIDPLTKRVTNILWHFFVLSPWFRDWFHNYYLLALRNEAVCWFVAIVVLGIGVARRLREASTRLAWWVGIWLGIFVVIVLFGSEALRVILLMMFILDYVTTFFSKVL